MDRRLTPEFFYGSAIAALTGLVSGLVLHSGWEKKPGGPQILSSTAQAAERSEPMPDDHAAPVDMAQLDTRYVPPSPLPVTRLAPDMFDVQPASAGEAERQDTDDLVAAPPPPAPPRDF